MIFAVKSSQKDVFLNQISLSFQSLAISKQNDTAGY